MTLVSEFGPWNFSVNSVAQIIFNRLRDTILGLSLFPVLDQS